MVYLTKFIVKFLLIFLVFLACFFTALKFSPSIRSLTARFIITNFIESNDLKVNISDYNLGLNFFESGYIAVKYYDDIIEIKNFKIEYSLRDFLHKGKIHYKFKKSNFQIERDDINFNIMLDGYFIPFKKLIYSNGSISVPKSNFKIDNVKFLGFDSEFSIKYKAGLLSIENFILSLKNDSNITLKGLIAFNAQKKIINLVELSGNIKEIPLDLYKLILPENHPVKNFLQENIEDGLIKEGKFLINIPNESFISFYSSKNPSNIFLVNKDNIKAEFHLQNFTYKYDPDLPSISNIDTNISLSGPYLNIKILSSNIGAIELKNANISLNLIDDHISVIAKAIVQSKVKDFNHFISDDVQDKIKNSGFDISSIDTPASTDVKIKIPLNDDENIFEIVTNVKNLEANFYNDILQLKSSSVDAKFNGNFIKIEGKGLINSHNSTFEIITKTNKEYQEIDYDTRVKAQINIESSKNKFLLDSEKLLINDGAASLNIEYINKNDNAQISINSDLTNLDFTLTPISLNKPKNQKSFLKIYGNLHEGKDQELSLKISGDNNLEILGKILISDNASKIVIDRIIDKNNEFRSGIEINKSLVDISLFGKVIDLSETNLFDIIFSESEENKRLKFKSFLGEMKMKNDISFFNVLSLFDCKSGLCNVGKLYSTVGTEDFLRINSEKTNVNGEDYQKWSLISSDAGSILKSVGITKKINNGNLILFAYIPLEKKNTNIVQGYVKLSNFNSVQNKILVRIISFISLPGILNALGNNKIYFNNLEMFFTYSDNVININYISADGQYFDIDGTASVDLNKKLIIMKGFVSPSIWGLNKLVGSLPLIGAIFSRKSSGILHAPFTFKESF